jgi:hypothetical protein
MLVTHLTSGKGHHETSPSTGFPLTFYAYIKTFYFYSCLYLNKFITFFILIEIENIMQH